MWRRQLVWWHTLFGALLGVSAALMLVTRGPHLWLQLACLTGMALAYAVWGRRGFGAMDVRAGLLYLTVAWALFLVLLFLDADGDPWILTFALFPQTWAILERRRAVPFVIVAVVAFAVVRIWQTSVTGESVAGILISSVIMLALSLVLGLFIDRIVREADSRARVIDELRKTQAQLAAAERERGVLTERERLSREIHDTLAQGFTSVVALARTCRQPRSGSRSSRRPRRRTSPRPDSSSPSSRRGTCSPARCRRPCSASSTPSPPRAA
jgi:signal transduction histidine kinase